MQIDLIISHFICWAFINFIHKKQTTLIHQLNSTQLNWKLTSSMDQVLSGIGAPGYQLLRRGEIECSPSMIGSRFQPPLTDWLAGQWQGMPLLGIFVDHFLQVNIGEAKRRVEKCRKWVGDRCGRDISWLGMIWFCVVVDVHYSVGVGTSRTYVWVGSYVGYFQSSLEFYVRVLE